MYTVVIADDEVELRSAVVRMIDWNAIGFEIVGEAENGVEALELVEKLEPDLLLTDIKMPFVSGIELARQAREIRPAMNIAFLSGYDDFKFAQQAIQYNIISYLLKPISAAELTKELMVIHDKMDEKLEELRRNQETQDAAGRQQAVVSFLMSMLLDGIEPYAMGEEEEERRLASRAIALGLKKSESDNHQFQVLVTRFFDSKQKECTNSEYVNFIQTILSKYVMCGSFYSKGKIVSLVSANERDLSKYVLIFTKEIIQNAQRVFGKECIIGVSRETKRLTQCNLAFYEAVGACEYAHGENNETYFISDIEKAGSLERKYIKDTTEELERLIKNGEQLALEQFLCRVFEECGSGRTERAHANFLCIQMMSTIYDTICAVTDEETAVSVLADSQFSEKLFVNYSQDKIREEIMKFCISARDVILQQRKLNSEIICDQAVRIIQEEYSNETLTLGVLSERLHISATYLSALIKKVKGESFINLLTEKRMQVAKDYLLDTSMKIMEITSLCGYSDQHYFSYCFKKYYGMSPNKMREAARDE